MYYQRLDSADDGTMSDEGPAPSRDDLMAELQLLRDENARLRSVLGLEEHQASGHAAAWSPMLVPDSQGSPSVDHSSSIDSKLALAASLFGARSDVYAIRWDNATTGKSGWSPATRGGWARQRNARDYLPLTADVLASHLRGKATIGIYPLLRGDTCALLACDFDKGTWALDALAFLDACHANGVPAVLERSRSGNGGHVWVFFDGPVAAAGARAMGAALLRQAMSRRAELDLASYDRFFPSQDFLPETGFGNLIALPLQGVLTARHDGVPRSHDHGALAGPVGVPVLGREDVTGRRD